MRPIIGITTSISEDERTLQLNQCHTQLLLQAGALPIVLAPTEDETALDQYADMLDGIMFSGGNDIDPMVFGEHQSWASGSISPMRDQFELALCRRFVQRPEKAVIGICRGFQVMNVALGGDLYQDIREGYGKPAIAHRQKQLARYASHPVEVKQSSMLHTILGKDMLMVNSLHHQALRRMGEGFTVTATAPDGMIEAAELTGHRFFLGVQWHPELLVQRAENKLQMRLFEAFVEAAKGK